MTTRGRIPLTLTFCPLGHRHMRPQQALPARLLESREVERPLPLPAPSRCPVCVLSGWNILHPLTAPQVWWAPHLPPVLHEAQLPMKIPGQALPLTQQEPCSPHPPYRQVNEKTNPCLTGPCPSPPYVLSPVSANEYCLEMPLEFSPLLRRDYLTLATCRSPRECVRPPSARCPTRLLRPAGSPHPRVPICHHLAPVVPPMCPRQGREGPALGPRASCPPSKIPRALGASGLTNSSTCKSLPFLLDTQGVRVEPDSGNWVLGSDSLQGP